MKNTYTLTTMSSTVTTAKLPRAARCIAQRDQAAHYIPPLPSRMPMP